jgi:uncharacterized membrane protein
LLVLVEGGRDQPAEEVGLGMIWAIPLVFVLIFAAIFIFANHSSKKEEKDDCEEEWWRAIK